jgi:hypothetical protein
LDTNKVTHVIFFILSGSVVQIMFAVCTRTLMIVVVVVALPLFVTHSQRCRIFECPDIEALDSTRRPPSWSIPMTQLSIRGHRFEGDKLKTAVRAISFAPIPKCASV